MNLYQIANFAPGAAGDFLVVAWDAKEAMEKYREATQHSLYSKRHHTEIKLLASDAIWMGGGVDGVFATTIFDPFFHLRGVKPDAEVKDDDKSE